MATKVIDFTISASQTDSPVLILEDYLFFALRTPTGLVTTSATLKAAYDQSGTYVAVQDDKGTAYSITLAAAKVISLDFNARGIAPLHFVKLVLGATEAADRTFQLICKR